VALSLARVIRRCRRCMPQGLEAFHEEASAAPPSLLRAPMD